VDENMMAFRALSNRLRTGLRRAASSVGKEISAYRTALLELLACSGASSRVATMQTSLDPATKRQLVLTNRMTIPHSFRKRDLPRHPPA
jgi:hypothetical protein